MHSQTVGTRVAHMIFGRPKKTLPDSYRTFMTPDELRSAVKSGCASTRRVGVVVKPISNFQPAPFSVEDLWYIGGPDQLVRVEGTSVVCAYDINL